MCEAVQKPMNLLWVKYLVFRYSTTVITSTAVHVYTLLDVCMYVLIK